MLNKIDSFNRERQREKDRERETERNRKLHLIRTK